ncbi:hypothetical protein ACMBCN_02200 [Candidatus Liberibacter asiaticus]|nr:hypothetical protein [Candidatus Liberibacter asiaticus]
MEVTCHFLRVICTLASTKFITSSFWNRCRGIGVLNNFIFNFLKLIIFICLFIFFFYF